MEFYYDRPTMGLMFAFGSLLVEFYLHPRVWEWAYHGQPCCRFFLCAGPLCIAWHNNGDS